MLGQFCLKTGGGTPVAGLLLLCVSDGSSDDVSEDLYTWLCGEPELAGQVTVSRKAPQSGEMGTLADALVVAVGAQGVLSVLAASLRGWFAQPRRATVKLKIDNGNGGSVDLVAEHVRSSDLEQLLRQTLEAAAGPRASHLRRIEPS